MDTGHLAGIVVVLAVVGATVAPATAGGSIGQERTGAGDRLQGAIGVQEAELEGELEAREFDLAFGAADSNASRADRIAEQVSDLEATLRGLRERKRTLDRARENDSIPDGEYNARIAVLAARTGTVERLANRTDRAAGQVPRAALRERGLDREAIRGLGRNASELAGPEVARRARSIAGQSTGRELDASNRPDAAGPPTDRQGRDTDRAPNRNGSAGPNESERGDGTGATAVDGPVSAVAGTAGAVAATARSVAAATVGSVVGTAAAQSGDELAERPLLEVPVEDDGSARVSLVLTFNLTSDAGRQAFETLEDDDRARADVKGRFQDRMASIANQSEAVVDREMGVDDAEMALARTADGEMGTVELSVDWEGLAAVEDRHLVVTEPFASGFTPDREFRVRITAPDSYRVTTASPEPATRTDGGVTWPAGADLDGFTLVFSPGERTSLPDEKIEDLQPNGTVETEAGSGVPGFGTGTALIAVGAVAVLVIRRR